MKLTTITLAVAAACVFAQSAEARGYHHHQRYAYRNFAHHYSAHHYEHHRYARRHGHAWRYAAEPRGGYAVRRIAYRGGGYGGRPRAWCGWYMRHLLGVSDPSYNLARNWAHWGHSGAAGVGAVVVWAHHVGKIVGQENGQWVIQSGNDGHAVRTRPRSIAGAIAIRWG